MYIYIVIHILCGLCIGAMRMIIMYNIYYIYVYLTGRDVLLGSIRCYIYDPRFLSTSPSLGIIPLGAPRLRGKYVFTSTRACCNVNRSPHVFFGCQW